MLGEGVSHLLPLHWVKGAAAVGFAAMGLKLLLSRSEPSSAEGEAN
jgi:putative Ca2+/H+ antiporter (TMEM165/GDT1 family)